jgi:hypothetical protein
VPDVKVKATIYLPEDVQRRLKIRAAEERSTMTELVVQAIDELLARPSNPNVTSSREPTPIADPQPR